MNLVLRPVNARFLTEVAFPAFERGLTDADAGLTLLADALDDERTLMLLEAMRERGLESSFFGLEDEDWLEVLHRLLFNEWLQGPRGWQVSSEYQGFGCELEECLHCALMVEDPGYFYMRPKEAESQRFLAQRDTGRRGMAALIAGLWEEFPPFAPDQVLTTAGRGLYDIAGRHAVADWSYRGALEVQRWSAVLPSQLETLLAREQKRLGTVEMVERAELLDFWLGRQQAAPLFTVSFTGLTADPLQWVRDIGGLANLVRQAASLEQGLTSFLSAATPRTGG